MRHLSLRHMRLRQLALVSVTGLALIFATSPSFAAGGAGGSGAGAGGSGGVGGSAGGGAGGVGNVGADGSPGAGGAGGAGAGDPGGVGSGGVNLNDLGGGGGGGGGGAHGNGNAGEGTLTDITHTGGAGGDGGSGGAGSGGGGGGEGGYGAYVTGLSTSVNTTSQIGGDGGDGGFAGGDAFGGNGGYGGDGGAGAYFASAHSLTNSGSGSIAGGAGGAGGNSTFGTPGADGAGGVGIYGADDLAVINSGTISGGLGGDGVTRANAITFDGDTNSLELQFGSGFAIVGNVVANGSADTLILGGTLDEGFNISSVGAAAQYRGFESFRKTGTSTWYLNNTTSAVTDWTISAGTLNIYSQGALGDTSSKLVLDGGTLQFGSGFTMDAARDISIGAGGGTLDLYDNDVRIDQAITGSGGLTAIDSSDSGGWLTLGGINTYTGDTTVDGAWFLLGHEFSPNASVAGDVYVLDGGLTGAGTVHGNLTVTGGYVVGGTRAPGYTYFGALHVGGNYVQGALGTFAAIITPTSTNLLEVAGTANLSGSLLVQVTPGVYTERQYTILTASSVTGTFDSYSVELEDPVHTEGLDIGDSVSYTSNSVIFNLGEFTVDPTATDVVSTQSMAAVDNAQGANSNLLGALDTLRITSGNDQSAMNSKGYVRLALADDSKLAGILAPAPQSVRTSVWTKVLGSLTSVDASNGKTGFDAKTGGVMVGADRSIGDGFTLGVAGSYSYTDVEDDLNSSSTINTGRVALYGRYAYGIYGIDAVLGYGHEWFDADRLVGGQVATSSHEGDEVNAAIAASVKLQTGDYVVIPKAGVGYVHFWEGGYTEEGAPGFNLNVSAREIDSLRPFVSVDVARSFETTGGTEMTPYVSAEYSREVMDNAPSSTVSIGGGSFIVNGISPSRDRVSLGAGIDVVLDKSMSLQIGYKAVLPTGNLVEHAVDAGVVFRF